MTLDKLEEYEREIDELDTKLDWLDAKWESHEIYKIEMRLNEIIELIEGSLKIVQRTRLKLITGGKT